MRGGVSGEQRQRHTLRLHKTLSCEMVFRKNNPIVSFHKVLTEQGFESEPLGKGEAPLLPRNAEAAVGTLTSNSSNEIITMGLGPVFIT